MSARAPLYDFSTQSAFVVSTTRRGGQLALGAAKSVDPWFFSSPDPVDLAIRITLHDVEVFASSDPDEFAYAIVEAIGAFGIGDEPGVDAIAEWSFFREVIGNGHEVVPFETMIDLVFPLEPDTTYWLTNRIAALAITDSVPEPGSAWLLVGGLLGLALLRRPRTVRAAPPRT